MGGILTFFVGLVRFSPRPELALLVLAGARPRAGSLRADAGAGRPDLHSPPGPASMPAGARRLALSSQPYPAARRRLLEPPPPMLPQKLESSFSFSLSLALTLSLSIGLSVCLCL